MNLNVKAKTNNDINNETQFFSKGKIGFQNQLLSLILLLVIGTVLIGCPSRPIKPTVPEIVNEKSEEVGQRKTLPKVALLLGPGAIRSYAHLGVIREFERAGVPISAIGGIEWGSLVAALYGTKAKSHDVEWKLQKLKAEHIPQKTLFNSKFQATEISKIKPFLESTLEKTSIRQFSIPFGCMFQNTENAKRDWVSTGLSIDAVQSCLTFPPTFLSNGKKRSAISDIKGAADELKKMGADIVVYVDLLNEAPFHQMKSLEGKESEQILWSEVRSHLREQFDGVDWVVSVNLGGADLLDFDKRRNFVLAGQQAGLFVVKKIVSKYGF
jgi:predicted acylesterase/phospholipase RssA